MEIVTKLLNCKDINEILDFAKITSKSVYESIKEDIASIRERDPAAKSDLEVLFLYPGFHALILYRFAHFLYNRKLSFSARFISQCARHITGIEIHPAAVIGRALFIDHGSSVVIGETAVIGDCCTIYQGVTLGGTGKHKGKRHPTLGNNVMIGAGAKVLGPIHIGNNSKVAAGAVVLIDIPSNSTAVGIPAKVVVSDKMKEKFNLDQINIPDPVAQELSILKKRIEELEEKLNG